MHESIITMQIYCKYNISVRDQELKIVNKTESYRETGRNITEMKDLGVK